MVAKYINEADRNFDSYDIIKLYGEVNISSVTQNGTLLTGNCKPFNGISDSIRLNVSITQSGSYVLEAKNVNMLALGKHIYLIDAFTRSVTDLNATSTYALTIDTNNVLTYGSNRLMLVVGDLNPEPTALEELQVANSISLYPALTNGAVTISTAYAVNEAVSVSITDASGRTMGEWTDLKRNNNAIRLDLSTYRSGAYIITVHSASGSTMLKCVKYE
jgi:hypothetical protein